MRLGEPQQTARGSAKSPDVFEAPEVGPVFFDESGLLKLIFRQDDMRLLGVHVGGEQATELVHLGLIAMIAEAGADLFNRTCFNYPTLGDLYKYATYAAMLKRDGLVVDDSGQLPARTVS
jgi:pyruvate/2-oxoglutarate dehydrogenase complex dihydrolipoamide dehydrogenase (E3) component